MNRSADHRPRRLTLLAAALLALALALAGCSTGPYGGGQPAPVPTPNQGGAAGGTSEAPGVTELPDGTVRIVGVLEFRDLEGGTWVITGGTAATGDAGKTLAVIANAADLTAKLEPLRGERVVATGTKAGGVSTRMAGPEYTISSIASAGGGGPAQ
jgi:hypothetical protein